MVALVQEDEVTKFISGIKVNEQKYTGMSFNNRTSCILLQDSYFKDLDAAKNVSDLSTVVFHTQPGGGAMIYKV